MFKRLLILCLLLVLASAGTGLWVWQGLATLKTPVTLSEPVLFNVEHGSTFSGVARQLERNGLVGDSLWLRLWGRLHPDRNLIQAGTYEFVSGDTALAMVRKMVNGDTKTWSVQFIEGWRFADLRQALEKQQHLDIASSGLTDAELMKRLGHPDEHPEGRFFPDTYVYTGQESDLDILRRAYDRMQSILQEEWQGRADDLPYESPYEALIMASIVEKETGVPDERSQIAGVFVRRLEKGMRLQTDPTVIYGLGDSYDGNITRKNLRAVTPYNTYRISGLPPTPIALPGREAIHAALHPDDGDSLYFVARGDGSHVFSRTLQEHQRAVRDFQLRRRSDYRSSPQSQ
ncbi:endolytic transglycosylase MltG [Marinobacter halodurans]|uniref:Endolytic murein transglycosylase n=1 Tax=Marinobacter halodurans TaxID=2528979 RepID=A0ABY1ZEF7_9GAMM|nr:endolytic transglycosylase MltG [Marinobacter halodurans]TBW48043.1 endolytic transglycosylase MltG [Marinobacter halodurans]